MKKAVITGATGMIGIALTKYLAEKNIEVYCVVRNGSKRKKNIPSYDNVKIVECDIGNYALLYNLAGSSCDAFFHFAWDGTFGDGRNDASIQTRNIQNTIDAVYAAQAMGCSVFVGAGSQAEYGRVEGILGPDTPVNPENGYGIAKYAAGKLSAILCAHYGIRHVWARILSVYGPFDGVNTMIMSCIRSFLKGDKSSFTMGEQVWDYLYSGDAARALYLMAENGKNGAIYPLGSGLARPLRDYILAIKNMINSDLKPGLGERPYSDKQVMHLCADISLLKHDTGFEPKTDFETGIRNTIQWVIEHT